MKFIYFDIGGVLGKDFSATNKWDLLTSDWGIPKTRKMELNKLFDEFENEACKGRNVEDFLLIVKEKFGIQFPINYSLIDDFVNRFYKNEGIEKIINKIKNEYKLGLLTNMYSGMLKIIMERKIIPNINWTVIIDSSVEKYKKPEIEIYKIAQEKSGVEAREILFIDNKKENLEIPKEMGWQTFWFDSSNYERSNKELESFLR